MPKWAVAVTIKLLMNDHPNPSEGRWVINDSTTYMFSKPEGREEIEEAVNIVADEVRYYLEELMKIMKT